MNYGSTLKVRSRSQKLTFPKGLTHFLFHVRKLKDSYVITSFPPVECNVAVCAHGNGPKSNRKKYNNFKIKKLSSIVNIKD